jgi:hypothetical protein
MTIQTLDIASRREADTSFRKPSELHPLVQSLQSVLKQIDDEYGRERTKPSQTLSDTCVKPHSLVMLKARHFEWRDNDVRELAALVAQPQ